MGGLWNGLLELIGTGLSSFYDLIPNYGVAIILLTVVISVLLFPLTLKQTRSMKAMQEIQPEVKRLQKELKGDREELNQELMALYKERNVNPAAGCLPMIVQLPIWFALFRVLRAPIQYLPDESGLGEQLVGRGPDDAEAAYEVTDFLGMNLQYSPNRVFSDGGIVTAIPYLILILGVVATGYYQTRQTMARQQNKGEQTQQQQTMQNVMKFFPIFFGVISWSLPAGLVLYFAVSQLFRIGQQAVILRLDGDGSVPAQTSTSEQAKPSKKQAAASGTSATRGSTAQKPASRGKTSGSSGNGRPVGRPQQGSKKKRKRRRR